MAEFKSLADLFKSVNKDIDQALDSGVSDYVTQVAISYAKQRVYNRYRIHYERKSRPHYVRRKSLLQEENWNSELVSQPAIEIGVSNHTVAIYNTAKPNKVLNDKGEAANNTDEIQSLPELIELGQKKYTQKFGGVGYMFNNLSTNKYRYLQARPFVQATVKQLNSNDILSTVFDTCLIMNGYRIKDSETGVLSLFYL